MAGLNRESKYVAYLRTAAPSASGSKVARVAWNLCGFLFIGLGIVGYLTPGLPGTVFMILALGCFVKGANDRQVAWLLNHPQFGHILRDWHENKWISARIKVVSVSCIVFFGTLSILALRPVWTRKASLLVIPASIAVTGTAGVTYILTRRTKPSAPASPGSEFLVDEAPGDVFASSGSEADPVTGDDLAPLGTGHDPERSISS